jgi:hypothetical protein
MAGGADWQAGMWLAFDWSPPSWNHVWEIVAVAAGIVLVVLFGMTLHAVWKNFGSIVSVRGAVLIGLYEAVWGVLLTLLAIDYIRQDPIAIRRQIGVLPTPVIWFGALGGVLVSLSAVADRSADGTWKDRWALWHLFRPVVGAIVGVIAVIVFQAGILSVGANPNPSQSTSGPPPQDLSYFIIAFVVGYRESAFRQLVATLVDTLFKTGSTKPAVDKVTPSGGPGGEVAIVGSGLGRVNKVAFGTAPPVDPTSVKDGYVMVTAPDRATATQGSTFDATKPAAVPVVVDGPDGTAAGMYSYDV